MQMQTLEKRKANDVFAEDIFVRNLFENANFAR